MSYALLSHPGNLKILIIVRYKVVLLDISIAVEVENGPHGPGATTGIQGEQDRTTLGIALGALGAYYGKEHPSSP